MAIQAHQEIVKKLVDLIGITSIMEVCFWQYPSSVTLVILLQCSLQFFCMFEVFCFTLYLYLCTWYNGIDIFKFWHILLSLVTQFSVPVCIVLIYLFCKFSVHFFRLLNRFWYAWLGLMSICMWIMWMQCNGLKILMCLRWFWTSSVLQ